MVINKNALETVLRDTLSVVPKTPAEHADKNDALLNIWTVYQVKSWSLPEDTVAPVVKAYGAVRKLTNQ